MAQVDFDVLIVGAGFGGHQHPARFEPADARAGGIFQLYKCRDELGLKCKLIDSFAGPGGTWVLGAR
jgi:hypothetical protein